MKKVSRQDRLHVKVHNLMIKQASGCQSHKEFRRQSRRYLQLSSVLHRAAAQSQGEAA